MDSKEPTNLGTIKITLLGKSGTGKTCLTETLAGDPFKSNGESTLGASFRRISRTFERDEAYKYEIECWDTSGQDRYHALLPMYVRKAALVLITLNPADVDNWQAQIQKYTETVRKASGDVEISYVVNHADKIYDRRQAGEMERIEQTIKTAHQTQEGFESEDPKIFYYSSAKNLLALRPTGEHENVAPKSHHDLLLEALDTVALEIFKARAQEEARKQVIQVVEPGILNQDPSYFTLSGFFKAAFLFIVLSVVFLSLGGVTGGVEHIWPNIDGLFEAIQLGTDWGIGVAVASLGLALVITSAAVAWDYYSSHRGEESCLKIEDEDGAGAGYFQQTTAAPVKTEGVCAGNTPPVVSQPPSGDKQTTKLVMDSWYKVTALESHQPNGMWSDFFKLEKNQTFYAQLTGALSGETFSLTTTDGKKGCVRQEKVHLEAVTEQEAMQHQISNVQKFTS